jgi:hypothetical protein
MQRKAKNRASPFIYIYKTCCFPSPQREIDIAAKCVFPIAPLRKKHLSCNVYKIYSHSRRRCSFDMRVEWIPDFHSKETAKRVWPLNAFAPWPRINYASRAIKCLPFGAENCAIGPWLLLELEVVRWWWRGASRSPPHKRKDLAAGAERASSQLSCDYLSSRMDGCSHGSCRLRHTTQQKNTLRRRCRLRPLLI